MIASLFTETVSVKRLAGNDDNNKLAYGEAIASLACAIQPFDDKLDEDIAGSFGKDWIMFSPQADVRQGDQVIWNGAEYKVMSVAKLGFAGESHMETVLRTFEP